MSVDVRWRTVDPAGAPVTTIVAGEWARTDAIGAVKEIVADWYQPEERWCEAFGYYEFSAAAIVVEIISPAAIAGEYQVTIGRPAVVTQVIERRK